MAKSVVVLLAIALATAFSDSQAVAQTAGLREPDLKTPFVGSNLTCSQPEKLSIPRPLIERAKIKARLVTVLRESLYDDAKGIVNIARENEIKKLVSKLRDDKLKDEKQLGP